MLSTSVVLPCGTPDVAGPATAGADLPVCPDPLTDGCGDRLVVVGAVERPSAVLVAARQLSDEADRRGHRVRGRGTSAGDRQLRRRHELLAERRAARSRPPEA